MAGNGAGPGICAKARLTAAFVLTMNSVFGNGFGRIGEALGATPHAKGDFSIFLDQVPSLATGTSLVLLLARHARLTVLSGIAAPSSD